MNWLQSIVFGIIAGITEILPISSSAHRFLVFKLFGVQSLNPIYDLLIHIAVLLAILFACRSTIEPMLGANKSHIRRRNAENMDFIFARKAVIPMVLCYLLLTYATDLNNTYLSIALLCLVNGVLLFLQGRSLQGNKTAGAMSVIDSGVTGVLYSLSVFSGISGIAVVTTYGIIRGADRERALNWALLLSIPALILRAFLLLLQVFTAYTVASFFAYLGYVIAAGIAFVATYLAIILMRFLAVRAGFSGFSYYCWGTALFSVFLHLI